MIEVKKSLLYIAGIIALIFLIRDPLYATDTYPSCNILKSGPVHFRSFDSKDNLRISVVGTPCYKATLKIVISDDRGSVVYSYESEFKPHVATNWADKDFDSAAVDHVNDIFEEGFSSSADLPESVLPEEPGEDQYEHLKIPDDLYKIIRNSPRPVFTHSTYYEGWRRIVYDRRTKKAIIVIEGGL